MTKRRNYGLVKAIIDERTKQVQLSFIPRKAAPLDDRARRYCLAWALSSLGELQEQGYEIDRTAIDSYLIE